MAENYIGQKRKLNQQEKPFTNKIQQNHAQIQEIQIRKNKGHWNSKQNLKYLVFIDYHRKLFDIQKDRDLWRVYKGMSNFIKTRDSSQCRSHHQKAIVRTNSLDSLILQLKTQYDEKEYKEMFVSYIDNNLQETQDLKFLKNTWIERPDENKSKSKKECKKKSEELQNQATAVVYEVQQNQTQQHYQPQYYQPSQNQLQYYQPETFHLNPYFSFMLMNNSVNLNGFQTL